MMKMWKWIAMQLADGLEKSTVGAITMFLTMACVLYLTITEGGSQTVDSLLTTAMIVSATLMGVNSVTDIFKKSDNRTLTINETISTTNTSKSECTTTRHEDINVTDNPQNNNRPR